MVAQMPNRLEGPRWPSLRGATAFLLVCAAGSVGCENTDPCVLRQAACIDVLLIGGVSKQGDALVYRDLTIKVNDANGKEILPAQTFPLLTDTSEKDVGIPRRPTGSGVYGRVTIKLAAQYPDRAARLLFTAGAGVPAPASAGVRLTCSKACWLA